MVRPTVLMVDTENDRLEAHGEIDFLHHHLGRYALTLAKQGHFLRGEVQIDFDERDGPTSAALGHPDIATAIAFHGDVSVGWKDIAEPDLRSMYPHYSRRVTLTFLSGGLSDAYEQRDFELAATTVIEALNIFFGRAVQDYFSGSRTLLAEAGAKS